VAHNPRILKRKHAEESEEDEKVKKSRRQNRMASR